MGHPGLDIGEIQMKHHYAIARHRGEHETASTYTVICDNRENLSHHESEQEARAAIKRYEAADKRRA
jgi:hypothetical protein